MATTISELGSSAPELNVLDHLYIQPLKRLEFKIDMQT